MVVAVANPLLHNVENEHSSRRSFALDSVSSLDIRQVRCEIASPNQQSLSIELTRLCLLMAMVLEGCLLA